MKILLAGPVEGRITNFLNKVEPETNWAICAGDFGIWPDPARMNRGARKYGETEFAAFYIGFSSVKVCVPTLTISGVHDDNKWLQHRKAVNATELIENVHWLAQGHKTTIGFGDTALRVTGLGKAYSKLSYTGKKSKRAKQHYTRKEVELACSSGPTDLFVCYEHLDAPGIRNIIFATRPKLVLSTNKGVNKLYSTVQNTPVIQLKQSETKYVSWDGKKFTV